MRKHFRAVELRCLDNDTVMKLREWRNQPFVKEMMFSQHDITEEEHRKYIEALKKDKNRGLFVFYLDKEPFAVLQYELNQKDRTVVTGSYLVDKQYQIMGYGCIMNYMIHVIEYCYLEADISYAEILDSNIEGIRLQKHFNGTLDDILKDYIVIDGICHDVYRYSHPIAMPDKKGKVGKLINIVIEPDSIEDMLIV